MALIILGVTAMLCGTVVAWALITASRGEDVDAVSEDVDLLERRIERERTAADAEVTRLEGLLAAANADVAKNREAVEYLRKMVMDNALQLERVTREKTNGAIAKILPQGAKS